MSGDSVVKRAKQLEMARRAMENRKGTTVEGSSVKKPKTASLRTPSSRINDLKTVGFEEPKTLGNVIATTHVNSAPPADILGGTSFYACTCGGVIPS